MYFGSIPLVGIFFLATPRYTILVDPTVVWRSSRTSDRLMRIYLLWSTIVCHGIEGDLLSLKIAFKNGVDLYTKSKMKSFQFQVSEWRLEVWLTFPSEELRTTDTVSVWQEKVKWIQKELPRNSEPTSWHDWYTKMSNKTLWFYGIFCMHIDFSFSKFLYTSSC